MSPFWIQNPKGLLFVTLIEKAQIFILLKNERKD